jgi:imidazolonepropionase-like amidohydrolase
VNARSFTLAAALAAALAAPAAAGGAVALKAGTIHLVDGGVVLEGGATIVVRDGRIVAVGAEVAIPPDAHVVDYGADAVIVPGLVAASSYYALGAPSKRTADPFVRALDGFDPYSNAYLSDLAGGVTTAYVGPARGRLLAGRGAVIKLAGDADQRVLDELASLDGTITAEARSVPGYWEPPVPATVDVGLGVAEPQLPGSALGAGMALRELIAFAKGRARDDGRYGPGTAAALREAIEARETWRIGADTEQEIRVLLEIAAAERLKLVIAGGSGGGSIADEIAAAGASVLVEVDVAPDREGRDFGKAEDARWPCYDAASKLAQAGVKLAIAQGDQMRVRDLRFAAALASRGGLPAAAALRAITLGAAEVLGVDGRVGSIAPGKDADFCVLNGPPLAATTSVVATWVGGESAWKSPSEKRAVVVEASELHLGDGSVLRPGQVLMLDSRIAEVGARVSHPLGAIVVRGAAAMPGLIDSLGFLGLEGSAKVPATDFKLAQIVAPGDDVDRRVARSGVTTVVLSPRAPSASGAPMMAYKPAASEVERMVVSDPAALRLRWTEPNRLESGKAVTQLLEKAREYDKKWREYEEAMAKWVPPADEGAAEEAAKKDGEEKAKDGETDKKGESEQAKDGEKKEEKKDESAGDKKDEDAKKKDKKKKDKDGDEVSVAGIWMAKVVVPPFADEARLRLRVERPVPAGERAGGSLRCDSVSSTLVALAGTFKDKKLALAGLGTRGPVRVEGETKAEKLEGTLFVGASQVKFTAERESEDLPVAARPELRRPKPEEKPKEPKGKPKSPGTDEKLEPFRRAMQHKGAIVVSVDREDEILACVAAFEAAGIQPVLHGADDAWRVARELRGRVAGVLLSQRVLDVERGKGLNDERNRYAELAAAGIPVAFHSAAEEGAAELATMAAYAVSLGLSPDGAVRALTSDAARMLAIDSRVGRLEPGLDGDVLLLDGPPLEASTRVLRAWVNGEEVP